MNEYSHPLTPEVYDIIRGLAYESAYEVLARKELIVARKKSASRQCRWSWKRFKKRQAKRAKQ